MNSRIEKWDNVVRQILLISALFMVYAGPAAAIGLDRFFDDEMFGESSPGEWAGLIFFIWLFAVPLVLAYAKWRDDPTTSATWLGVFLGLMTLPILVGIPIVHMANALVVLPALWLPFSWLDVSGPSETVAFWIARVCTLVILIGVPIVALVFQMVLKNTVQKTQSADIT